MADLREENASLVDQNSNNKILDPRGRYLRWIAMIFMCFLPFGAYYCDDNPAGLQDVMKEDLKISSSTFTSFYSWYSWPNVIESLSSAQSAYTVSWFFGKQLNFVFGLQLSFSRVASLINLNTIRPIYDSLDSHISGPRRIGVTLLIAASTCIFSLGCALILWWLDNRHRRGHHKDNPNDAAASLWPLVAFLVPKQMLGTAYGLMQSIQNLGFAIINILTGLILDQYGYFMLEIFFIVCLEIALLAAAFLYVYNSFKKGLLNDSPAVRQAKQEQLLKMSSPPQIFINAITSTPVDPENREKTRATTNIQANVSSTC
ncbi:unnamed protein product [Adineta steineri]|uniref:Uncharacterized protein n=1 Tax=Adineta steineri TaxID=433720 RepID=A0A814WXF5_9BILA|nr:unnamed protein product [Adineta steineri]